MEKIWINTFVSLLCLLPIKSSAEVTPYMQRRCDDMLYSSPVEIEINYDLGSLKYDMTKDNEGLSVLYQDNNTGRKPNNTVNGLTVQNGYFRLTMDIENRTIKSGYKCYYPAKVVIDMGFKDSTIYIAKSLKSGTCRFELTKRHEHTHLSLGKAGLLAQVELLRKTLPIIIKKQGAIVSEEGKESAEKKLFDAYNTAVNETRQMMADITAEEQQKLDTTENYLKESILCSKD